VFALIKSRTCAFINSRCSSRSSRAILKHLLLSRYDVTRRKLWTELVERERLDSDSTEELSVAIKRIQVEEESCRGNPDEQMKLSERLKVKLGQIVVENLLKTVAQQTTI